MVGDLAALARGAVLFDEKRCKCFKNLVKSRTYDLALRAYDNIGGEDTLEAVMPGVEGVLYADLAPQSAIRNGGL